MAEELSNLAHADEIPWSELTRGKFRFKRKLLGEKTGATKLGCSLYEVPSGASAWPAHFHYANEEAIYVIAGAGTLRLGEREVTLRAGDFVTFLPGPAHSHRLINTSDAPLTYLCFSTMIEPEVCIYPDSKKTAVGVGPRGKRVFAASFRLSSGVDYYQDESDASDR